MKLFFSRVSKYLLYIIAFLLPVFFLNITQEFYTFNKIYLLGFSLILILVLILINFIFSKKISWNKTLFDGPIFLFLFFYASSLILMSPNKIQALLNTTVGGVIFLILFLFYFVIVNILKQEERMGLFKALSYSSIILSITAIIFFFNPFKDANLPNYLTFLKNQTFSPIGSPLDLAIFLGFFLVYYVVYFFTKKHQHDQIKKDFTSEIVNIVTLFLTVIAISLSVYTLVKPINTDTEKTTNYLSSMPPISVTWYSAVETLKKPINLFFGVGPDNFAAIFTKVKPADYNSTDLWAVNYNQGSSFILQLWAETGILGLLSFGLILILLIKTTYAIKQEKPLFYVASYLLLAMLFLPISFIHLFLLIIILTLASVEKNEELVSFEVGKFLPVYFGVIILSLLVIAPSAYMFYQTYLAEFYFKKSLNGIVNDNAKELYENQRMAVIINPYLEKYRMNFAQTNLLIANNIASKNKDQITDQDRQNITQAIQSAISEAKAVVTLNPQKSANWENLALIYKNILNVAQGADAWTIAAYQRAILADANNPSLRLNLGGVYFSLKNFDEAIKMFEQAIALKSDWPNAHYNLAHAYFEKKDYEKAALSLQNTLSLIDPKTDDYKKTVAELEEVKKLLPTTEEQKNESLKKGELTLPSQPEATLSPKLQLENKEATPNN